MKVLSVTPRSAEWHAIRDESWTASTGAMLVVKENAELLQRHAAENGVTLNIEPLLAVGLTSYFGHTPWKLWAEKLGQLPKFKGNTHTERGTSKESIILDYFKDKTGFEVTSDVTATSSEHPWLLASFDGIAASNSDPTTATPYGFPVEVKCPAFPSRKKLWDSKSAGQLAIKGLPYYWVQVQHQIFVAQAPYAWFVAAGVEKEEDGREKIVYPLYERVPRDYKFLEAYVAISKYYFDTFIDACVEPPKLPSDLSLLEEMAQKAALAHALATENQQLAVELYLDAVKAEEEAANRRKILEETLLKTAEKLRSEGTDMIILADKLQVTYASSTSVSWQKVAKHLSKSVAEGELAELVASCTSKRTSVKIKEVS